MEENDDLLRELFEVWNPLGMEGVFVLLRGYIDESYNEHVFTLSCLLTKGKIWDEFARSWKIMLRAWNRKLEAQGRSKISRYHAADCSNFKREFADWTKEEQREFFSDILKVFARHPVETVAFSLDLGAFYRVFPEAITQDPTERQKFIYGMSVKMLLGRIADRYCVEHPNTKFALVHDHCDRGGTMYDAFNAMKNDPGFEHGDCFVTFASSDWQHCIPLQPTDLVAYENFKDAMREVNPRDRRISLDLLLDLDSFGGRAQLMGERAILKMRHDLTMAGIPSLVTPIVG